MLEATLHFPLNMSVCICAQVRTNYQPSGRSAQEAWRVATSMTGPAISHGGDKLEKKKVAELST